MLYLLSQYVYYYIRLNQRPWYKRRHQTPGRAGTFAKKSERRKGRGVLRGSAPGIKGVIRRRAGPGLLQKVGKAQRPRGIKGQRPWYKKISPTRMRSRHKTQNIDMKAVILR